MNYIRLASSLCLGATLMCAAAGNQKFLDHIYDYIENLDVYEFGQEEGHAYYHSEHQMSLNGSWRFMFAPTPEGIPSDFYRPDFNDRKWAQITVPGNWEMQGFGDPQFRNVSAPFRTNPPLVPREDNPTGAYRRTFDLPADWLGQQVFLRLEKAQSASFVWINGKEVGYNEGSQEPAEYDITPYLKKGRNTIAVFVVKYSDGYYLEGQDYWRLAGIFDDVTLYATPCVRLFDWYVTTDLDDEYRDARLNIAIDIKNYTDTPTERQVRATVSDAQGRVVSEMLSAPFTAPSAGKHSLDLAADIANPAKWTAETPTLYDLRLELLDGNGAVEQTIDQKIGFKETCIKGQVFYLNGQPIKVNAQNSHMQHPDKGHAMDEATIRKDMEILKQHNFNAVRTSHYPPTNRYLELADQYGLYIIDEAGTEAHATEQVSGDSRFAPMYRDRVRKMVLRDRNHPSVLFWSAGNESGEGQNITEAVKEGKRLDPTRYFMYGGNAYSHPGEEIIGPRYPTPFELEIQTALTPESEDPRPSFMDEYLSVAGNAGGGMDEYWQLIRRHPRLMGGALWDFVSPGITGHIRRIDDSSPYGTPAHLMGNAYVDHGTLHLNGHDQWVEVYRADNVEVDGNGLTISFDVKPGPLTAINDRTPYVTKGSNQFGVMQTDTDRLQFYLHTGIQHRLEVDLPADWQDSWHNVRATWDGHTMRLYIDGQLMGSESTERQPSEYDNMPYWMRPANLPEEKGRISNFPFPVNIGRIAAGHGQEPRSLYTADAQMRNVAIYDRCLDAADCMPDDAVLYLAFDSVTDEGTYFHRGGTMRTYGSIWPDRTVQPEMLQFKHTTRPVSIRLLDSDGCKVEVSNHQYFTDLSAYTTHWQLQADGETLQQGDLQLQVEPQCTAIVEIPVNKPQIEPGREYRLLISTRLKNDEVWAPKGHEVAWDQIELNDWNLPKPLAIGSGAKVQEETAGDHLYIYGDNFRYTFNRNTGNLDQIEVDGAKMLTSPLSFNLWRAPLANESDDWDSYRVNTGNAEGFGQQVANLYYAKGLDSLENKLAYMDVRRIDGNVELVVRQQNLLAGKTLEMLDPYIRGTVMAGFTTDCAYTFADDGSVLIRTHMSPQGKLPELLPRIGLKTTVDKAFDNITWYGRGPQENYPDRKTGYRMGVWQTTADAMYEPYILPQDHGLRTDLRYLQLQDGSGRGLRIAMDEPFNFNAYPFSTDNLTKSNFTFQLQPEPDEYTLNLDYLTTGVGCTCIYVLDEYRTRPTAVDRTILLTPCLPQSHQ